MRSARIDTKRGKGVRFPLLFPRAIYGDTSPSAAFALHIWFQNGRMGARRFRQDAECVRSPCCQRPTYGFKVAARARARTASGRKEGFDAPGAIYDCRVTARARARAQSGRGMGSIPPAVKAPFMVSKWQHGRVRGLRLDTKRGHGFDSPCCFRAPSMGIPAAAFAGH